MNDRDMCGNENALMAFLYDEGDAAERDAMKAHVALCTSCAEEIESLRLTRMRLSAWAPPDAALGFRMTQDEDARRTATVLTNPRWWTRPLPAWAQAAAAIVIFAGGMALGTSRASTSAGIAPSTSGVATAAAVSREDFDALRAEVMTLRKMPANQVRVAADVDEDAVLRRVSAVVGQQVTASEMRQRGEFEREIAELAYDIDVNRKSDLTRVASALNRLEAATGETLVNYQDFIRTGNRYVDTRQVRPASLVR